MNWMKNKYLHIIFFIILSILMIWVGFGFKPDLYLSSDGFFHLGRFEYLHQNIKEFNFFNDFYTDNYLFEMGYPLGIFYPQGLMYPFVGLSLILGLNYIQGFQLMLVLIVFLTLLSFYLAFQRLYKDKVFKRAIEELSFIGALLYVLFPLAIPVETTVFSFASYFSLNLYRRMSISEIVCMILFPWVIVGLKEIISAKPKGFILLWSLLGILYTHVISGVFAGLMVILFLGYHFHIIRNSKLILREMAKTILLFLLMGAYQIFPMLEMMMSQRFGYHVPFMIKGSLFEMANPIGKVAPVKLLLIIQIFIGISLFYLFLKYRKSKYNFLIIAFIGIYLSSKLFPWQYFENTPLTVIQFPFRISFVFALFTALSLPLLFDDTFDRRMLLFHIFIPAILVMTNLFSASTIGGWNKYSEKDMRNFHPTALFIGAGAEYLPAEFDVADLNKENGFTFSYTLNKMDTLYKKALEDDYLLPKFYYRGCTVLKDGKEIKISKGYSGLIETKIPVKENEVVIQRKRSVVQNVTFGVTMLTVIIYGFYIVKKKKG